MYIYHKQCGIMQKFNEKVQTANFSVSARRRRPRQELFAKNMENQGNSIIDIFLFSKGEREVPQAHLVLNLLLEGPDHKEEVGAKHPPKDAADDLFDGEADEGPQDDEDVEDESHYSQVDPRPHEADVPLKYKYISTRNQPRIQR